MLGPILPVLQHMWGMSDAQAGMLLACEFAGGFCGALACGWLARRKMPATLLTWGLTLLTAGLSGAAFVSRAWMPVCLFGCGLGLGFINPMANLMVARIGIPSPATALNLFACSWAVGALAAPSAIGVLLGHQSAGDVFVDLARISGVAMVLAACVGRPAHRPESPRSSESGAAERSRLIAATGAFLFLYVGVETSVSVWLPTAAARWTSMSARDAAATQSCFWVALLVGRLLAPLWLRYLRPRFLILGGMLVGAAGIGVLLTASGPLSMGAGAAIAGLGLAPVNPTILATFTMALGPHAARWIGPIFAAAPLGGAAIPWIVGALSSGFGSLRAGFVAPILALCLMFFLQFAAFRQARTE